jgi:ubiquitin fusion degradation protein 1
MIIQPPAAFYGAGSSLNGQAGGSSSKSTGKGKNKATEDTETKKADEAKWGTGQGRSLGSRQSHGAGPRTLGAGLVGVGGTSAQRLSQRPGRKPPRRERSPTPDFGIDDDDVIVIDSDVD